MRWFGHQEITGGFVVSKEIDKLIEAVLKEEIRINLSGAPVISLPDDQRNYTPTDKTSFKWGSTICKTTLFENKITFSTEEKTKTEKGGN